MKKLFVLTALILAVGCSSNPGITNKQSALELRHTKTPIIAHSPMKMQTSSISSMLPNRSNVSMKNNNVPEWLFGGKVYERFPAGQNPSGQYPAGQYPTVQYPTYQNPSNQTPTNQAPANQTPTNQAPAEQAPSSGQFDQQVLKLVNAERAKSGLKALIMDSPLSNMALVKAQDLINNNYFDHNSPTYGSPFDMMKQYNITYNYAGENIAKGQPTAERVMSDWMNSPGHRKNIMSNNFTKIGIGYYKGAWVQEFTG